MNTNKLRILHVLRDQNLILFLGRIHWKKGLDRLIPALTELPAAKLIIAGNDELILNANVAAEEIFQQSSDFFVGKSFSELIPDQPDILEKILSFIPNVISAILILFFATLLAGLVESLVKGSIRNIDPKTGRALGKISSYLVITIGILIGISELGIASEFILILFVGFVSAMALGLGLALGLGGQDLVKKLLDSYYKENIKK